MRLNELIKEVYELKEQSKLLKKKETELKALLTESDIVATTYDNIDVSYKSYTRSSIDEDKLVSILKGLAQVNPAITECLEVKEIVNEDRLQDMIYNGYLSPDDIADAYVETESKRLTVKRGRN